MKAKSSRTNSPSSLEEGEEKFLFPKVSREWMGSRFFSFRVGPFSFNVINAPKLPFTSCIENAPRGMLVCKQDGLSLTHSHPR